jgi:cellobiose phosphorylase
MAKSENLTIEEINTKKELDALVKSCKEGVRKGKSISSIVKEKEMLQLQERYSKFSATLDSENFIISDALDIHRPIAPRPYFHALNNFSFGGTSYGSLWDQSGFGFSYLNAVRGGEVTRNDGSPYKPYLPAKTDNRIFYLREKTPSGNYTSQAGEKVAVWSVFPLSESKACLYSDFHAKQTPVMAEISAAKNNVAASLTVLVPDRQSGEVWKLTLTNRGPKKKELDLFARVHWGLDSYPASRLGRDEQFTGDIFSKANAVLLRNIDIANQNPRTAFFASSQKIEGFELSEKDFEGSCGCDGAPGAVLAGGLTSKTAVSPGDDLITALHLKITLGPSGSKTLFFVLGALSEGFPETRKQVEILKKSCAGEKAFRDSLRKKEASWKEFSQPYQVRTPDSEFDRFFNVWTAHQLVNTALFMDGGPQVRFRDKMQVLSALTPLVPEVVRKQLRETICYQLKDGRAVSRIPRFKEECSDEEVSMDNTLWMVDAVCRYINETGDMAFLDESIGFFDPKLQTIDNSKNAKVYDHIMAAVKCLFDYRGRFGLCKVGSRDRNEALTQITKLGGVSAWLSMALIRSAMQLFPYARIKNIKRDVGYLNTILENMYSNLNNYSWNGRHYTYAYDDNGNPIGAKNDREGAVHLTSNLWALLCGAAEKGNNLDALLAALDAVDTPFGYRNLTPPYSAGFSGKGGIPDLTPGTFENGSIDAFNRAFAVYAFAEKGKGKAAYEILKKGLPGCTLPDISTANPNQISEFIVGPDHQDFGRNMYDIFNPAISWIRLAMERIIGVVPVYEGLLLSPSIPPEWQELNVRKKYRGQPLSIRFHNPSKKECGIRKVTVNGKELAKDEGGQYVLDISKFKGAAKNKPLCVDALLG